MRKDIIDLTSLYDDAADAAELRAALTRFYQDRTIVSVKTLERPSESIYPPRMIRYEIESRKGNV